MSYDARRVGETEKILQELHKSNNNMDILKADRFNEGKRKWSLIDFRTMENMVKVLEYGATKYSANNWKKGLKVTETCESMIRHLLAFIGGENNDPESGLSHIGHIQCNAMFLEYMMRFKPEFDDRENL